MYSMFSRVYEMIFAEICIIYSYEMMFAEIYSSKVCKPNFKEWIGSNYEFELSTFQI